MALQRFRRTTSWNIFTPEPQNWGDIFNPSTYPEYSYKPRSTDDISRVVTTLTQTSSGVLAITGMSRTGKTCLMEYCLRETEIPYIALSGSRLKSIDDFWSQLASQLNDDDEHTTQVERGWTIEGVITFLKLGVSRTVTKVRDKSGHSEVLEDLNRQNIVIIVDDFHHVPEAARSEILSEIKTIAFYDRKTQIKFALLYVPTREMSKAWKGKAEQWNERIDPVTVTLWSSNELADIGNLEYLRYKRSLLGLQNLALESFGLPSIMQRYCREYCIKYLRQTSPNVKTATIEQSNVNAVFRNVANNLWELAGGEQFYRQLTLSSLKKVSGESVITLNDGRKGNINTVIWYALSQIKIDLTNKTIIQIEIDQLIAYLAQNSNYVADVGSKRKVRNRLIKMSEAALAEYDLRHKERGDFISDPFFEYDDGIGLLTIYNPSYMVALRHSSAHDSRLLR